MVRDLVKGKKQRAAVAERDGQKSEGGSLPPATPYVPRVAYIAEGGWRRWYASVGIYFTKRFFLTLPPRPT